MNPASISHHLDDATLLAYAAGTLPEAFDLMVGKIKEKKNKIKKQNRIK